MGEDAAGISVELLGLHGSGVRTLVGSLSGTGVPAETGEREWEGAHLRFAARRPEEFVAGNVDILGLVVSARQGVPGELSAPWQSASEAAIPAIVIVTHLDDASADFEEIAAMCTRVLADGGEIFLPSLPILDDSEAVCGFINLLSEEIVDWSDGGPVVRASEPRHQELIEDARAELCEAIMVAVEDDALFHAYMSGEIIDGEVIEEQMIERILRGLRHPVLGTGLTPRFLGAGLALDLLADLSETRSG